MKYTILLCAFILALVGAVCVFATRKVIEKIFKEKEDKMNHKVKSIKLLGWLILIASLFIIYRFK